MGKYDDSPLITPLHSWIMPKWGIVFRSNAPPAPPNSRWFQGTPK